MRSKWPDFLFTVAVRFACGAVLGLIASIVISAPLGLFGDEAHPRKPYYWIVAWSLGGAIIALWTTPKWQTPWYRRDSDESIVWTELGTPGDDRDKANPNVANKSVTIRTVSKDGEQHEYSSMEEAPPEIRSEIEALEKEAFQQKGEELSVTERSQTGDAITSKIIHRKSVSVYKIVDESGVERVYHSLEEMPPEIRAAFEEAENKSKG